MDPVGTSISDTRGNNDGESLRLSHPGSIDRIGKSEEVARS